MNTYLNATHSYTEKPDLSLFKRHTHDNYEIFCFLSGDARYFVEGNTYDLNQNDILIIKKSESHALIINRLIPYSRYVVNFSADALLGSHAKSLISLIDKKPLGRYNRIPANETEKQNQLHYLERVVYADSFEEKQLYLTVLLTELCKNFGGKEDSDYLISKNEDLIKYINKNLFKIANLNDICSQFYISKTHLNRIFKNLTGSTVWEYIIAKRLITAKDMLSEGIQPNLVSEKCGWSEYSSFYRSYKLYFGVSPKADYQKNKRNR